MQYTQKGMDEMNKVIFSPINSEYLTLSNPGMKDVKRYVHDEDFEIWRTNQEAMLEEEWTRLSIEREHLEHEMRNREDDIWATFNKHLEDAVSERTFSLQSKLSEKIDQLSCARVENDKLSKSLDELSGQSADKIKALELKIEEMKRLMAELQLYVVKDTGEHGIGRMLEI